MTEQRIKEDLVDSKDKPDEEQGGDLDQSALNAEQLDEAGTNEAALSKLREQVEENWNKYLRVVAELENFRKRSTRDLEHARKYGVEQFARAVLPVRDSIEAALTVAETADIPALVEGQRATLRLLDQALENAGVAEIDPHGEPFDPSKHEALSMLPSAHTEPNSVLEVVQKGFEIHTRLMRPARVIIAQPPAEEEGD